MNIPNRHSASRGFLVVVAAVASSLVAPTHAGLVVSQVYGGGGNAGATYTNDFVELFNDGPVAISLNGLSVQYASATGTGLFGANTVERTELPNVLLQPWHYFLIQEFQGAGGTTSLPSPDLVDPTPINLALNNGKVALVSVAVALGCNGGSTPCNAAQLALILDLVGYGNANFFEGPGAAPTITNTTADFRRLSGLQDTDNNSADFVASTPNPRNTASPANVPEPATLALLAAGLAGLGISRRRRLN